MREGVDEPGNFLVGSSDSENRSQSSQAVDPDDPSRSQLDVRSDLRPRHLFEVAHLQHQRLGLVGSIEKEGLGLNEVHDDDDDDTEGYPSGDGEDAEDDLEASKEIGGKVEWEAVAEGGGGTPLTTHPKSQLILASISSRETSISFFFKWIC